MKRSIWKSLVTKIATCLFVITPLQAMLYRTTNKVIPTKSTYLAQYQKAATTKKFLTQRAQTNQKKPIFSFDQSSPPTKKSWGALLIASGLGLLWHNSQDENTAEEKTDENHISLDQFIKRFTPPKEIQKTIEEHKNELSPNRIKPYLIKGTQPPMYHKWNSIDRIINAEILREISKQNNLNIEIPKKYIYPNPNNGKYEVFAKGMPGRSLGTEQLTLKEIQTLITLAANTGFTGFSQDNMLRNTQNNKLIIIDTERGPVMGNEFFKPLKIHCINLAIKSLNDNFKISRDAQVWVSNYSEKLEEGEEGRAIVDLYASRYNTLNISAENVKELEQEVWKQNHKQESFTAQAWWFLKHTMWSKT